MTARSTSIIVSLARARGLALWTLLPWGTACLPAEAAPLSSATDGDEFADGTGGESGGVDSTGVDPDDDQCSDPCPQCPEVDPPNLPEPGFGPMYAAPNRDDDDANGQEDWDDPRFEGDDDFHVLEVPGDLFVGEGDQIGLAMVGDTADVRVFHGDTLLLGDGATVPCPTIPRAGATLRVEFRDFWRNVSLTFHQLDLAGNSVASQTIRLAASPLMVSHHLQQAEEFWVVGYSGDDIVEKYPISNIQRVSTLERVLGHDRVTVLPALDYAVGGMDDWVQDEVELGYALGDRGDRGYPVVIDSPREGGLAPFPLTLEAPDNPVLAWDPNPGGPSNQDSYGNLEATPPVTVDDIEYPFGRVYYGVDQSTLHADLLESLTISGIQRPIAVDVEFLKVGHVDEVISFLPDPSSPKGFKLVLASPARAYQILDGVEPDQPLPLYRDAYGLMHDNMLGTVGDLLAWQGLRDRNEEIQQDDIDPIRAQLMAELGLTDADIIDAPVVFMGGGTSAVAFTSNMVNMLVATCEEGTTHVFVPDPFMRADIGDVYTAYELLGVQDLYDPDGDPMDLGDQSSDPFIQDFLASMPPNVEAHFVDAWHHHMRGGEVHCGTNTRRRIPKELSWAAHGDLPPLETAPWTCGCTPQNYDGMPPAFVGTPSPTVGGQLDWDALDAELAAYEDPDDLVFTVAVPYDPGNGCGSVELELPTPCGSGYTDYKVWRMGGAAGILLFPPQLPGSLDNWAHNPGYFAEGMMDPTYMHPAKAFDVVGCAGLGQGFCAIGSYGDGLASNPLVPSDLARTDPGQGPLQPGPAAYEGHIRAFPTHEREVPDPGLPEGYQQCFDVIDLHAQGGSALPTCQGDALDHGAIYLAFQAREKLCNGT